VGGDFTEFTDDGGEVDAAVARGDPLECSAAGVFIEDRVAEVAGGDVGGEDFDGEERVLEHPHGVAGIEADGDVVGASFFDEEAGFAGGEVAVIFEGDFDVEVLGEGANGAEVAEDLLEEGGDGGLAKARGVAAHEASEGAGAEGVGGAESGGEVGDGVAVLQVVTGNGAADAADGGVEGEALLVGGLLYFREMGGVEGFELVRDGELEGIGAEGGGVVDELESLPLEGTKGVRVYPEQGNSRLRHRNQDIGE
jgi:hypothetical protein